MIRLWTFLLILLFTFTGYKSMAQSFTISSKYALIPYPSSLEETKGNFKITKATSLVAGEVFSNEATYLQFLFQNVLGRPLKKYIHITNVENTIILQQDSSLTAIEGYHISIQPGKMILSSKYPIGMFRAVQTIRQLLPISAEQKNTTFQNQLVLPALEITDEPMYNWRGLHLDVSRHFFSIQYLKKLVDIMSLYKLNKLHLHLTDDQGWRIQIKKYPKLTDEGAWREFNKQDSDCIKSSAENPDMAIDTSHIIHKDGKTLYGGFYTQQEMKDFVAYASSKYIDIIPEIDMPGHMMTAIHLKPDLSCEGGSKWGELFSTPICPCTESTYEFAENVFSEIMDIFPSEYIHLGADEVDRKTWESSSACKELMQQKGLKNTLELQSYFVTRLEKFFHSKGRKLIGWDEILEGGINSSAYVMYWRSWVPDAPVKAARNGNHVIMSPGDPLYFDNLPDAHSLYNIYHFKVVPEKLTTNEAKFILGAQANLWTEHVPSENRADYLYMPRMTALAELVWSKNLNFNTYLERLNSQYPRLDALHVHYRLPDITGIVEQNVFTDSAILDIKKPQPDLILRYTIDGSSPSPISPALNKPLIIKNPVIIKLAAFTAMGLKGDTYTMHYIKEKYIEPIVIAEPKAGLQCRYYKKYFKNTLGMIDVNYDSSFITNNFVIPSSIDAPSFGLKYTGYIDLPETGVYTFYLLCDDGGRLQIGDKEVVNNDGQHSALEKSGQVALKKGLHPFQLDFIEAGGGFKLELKYSNSKGKVVNIPANFLKHL